MAKYCSLILIFVLEISDISAQYSKDAIDKLRAGMEALSSEKSSLKSWTIQNELEELTVDLGPAAIPELKKIFIQNKGEGVAGYLLARIGGEEVLSFLWDAYQNGHPELAQRLCIAIASDGGQKNISFLLNIVARERDWWNSAQAIYTLGTLKAREAVPQLKLLSKETGRWEGFAARNALDWITGNAVFIDCESINGISKDIISSIVDSGIPAEDSYSVNASEDKGFWKEEDGVWHFYKKTHVPAIKTIHISFSLHISPDQNRARVLVHPLGETGGPAFKYFLQRNNNKWKVTSMSQWTVS